MKLHVDRSRPLVLRETGDSIGYTLDLAGIKDRPGVYIFGRQGGSGFEALYTGSSKNRSESYQRTPK
jgi:hypothetical protein